MAKIGKMRLDRQSAMSTDWNSSPSSIWWRGRKKGLVMMRSLAQYMADEMPKKRRRCLSRHRYRYGRW